MVTAQDFSGLPNLDTLDLSRNSLNDESFVSNSLTVSKRSASVSKDSFLLLKTTFLLIVSL